LLWHAVDSHFQDLKVVIFHIIREDGPQIVCVHVQTETLHLYADIHLYNIRIYIYIIHTYIHIQVYIYRYADNYKVYPYAHKRKYTLRQQDGPATLFK